MLPLHAASSSICHAFSSPNILLVQLSVVNFPNSDLRRESYWLIRRQFGVLKTFPHKANATYFEGNTRLCFDFAASSQMSEAFKNTAVHLTATKEHINFVVAPLALDRHAHTGTSLFMHPNNTKQAKEPPDSCEIDFLFRSRHQRVATHLHASKTK